MVLLIVTLLGIASLRGGIMQERMAANIAKRNMSFQVAEAGLRQAELIARDGTVTFPPSGCAAGRCAKESADGESDNGFWDSGEAGYQTGAAVPIGENCRSSPSSSSRTTARPPCWATRPVLHRHVQALHQHHIPECVSHHLVRHRRPTAPR